MASVDGMLTELEKRFEKDWKRMGRWRQVHRSAGLLLTAVVVGVPALGAVGFVDTGDEVGKLLMGLASLSAVVVSTYRPLVHSRLRRSDMNRGRALWDELRATVSGAASDEQKRDVFKTFSEKFRGMYEDRGDHLIETELAKHKRQPDDQKKDTQPATK